MEFDVFTAGVKPGGLNSSKHIRIMLCYLLSSVPKPLTSDEIKISLLGKELVNYFELVSILGELCENGFIKSEDDKYYLLPTGQAIANALFDEVPLSVREAGLNAAITAQRMTHKSAQNKAEIEKIEDGYNVHCHILEGGRKVFSTTVYMPDKERAMHVQSRFIARGDSVFALVLSGITGYDSMSAATLKVLQQEID